MAEVPGSGRGRTATGYPTAQRGSDSIWAYGHRQAGSGYDRFLYLLMNTGCNNGNFV